jgi:phosphoribosylaminoimidazolecarboxamide formyltransferase/IMP cyclohydrolase
LKKIQTALISTFYKEGLDELAQTLHQQNVTIYSTGGTQAFLEQLGIPVIPVETLTGYPSILGGRVKTLHPKVFGGILARRNHAGDTAEMAEYSIPYLDLVVVNLYPFEETVASGADEPSIIEKIDIGGISLIRAAAKNFNDTLILADQAAYAEANALLKNQAGCTTLDDRRRFAARAFHVSSHYDSAIFNYFNAETRPALKISTLEGRTLRYGENPHQRGWYFGNLEAAFEQHAGKELSYNNLLDIDATLKLLDQFEEPTFVVVKHNNACGVASRPTVAEAWKAALEADPVSAFGGILAVNRPLDETTAREVSGIFFEVILAPSYSPQALAVLMEKKNRIVLERKPFARTNQEVRSALNGFLVQDADNHTDGLADLRTVTTLAPSTEAIADLLFAAKVCKSTKSNTIVLAKNGQLLASGTGQTSRVDALKQAIAKAKAFGFDLNGAAMASDAFFPFPDCVEIAHGEGIRAVIQPGGSIKDQLSIDFCNEHQMAMVFTGIRHFKH